MFAPYYYNISTTVLTLLLLLLSGAVCVAWGWLGRAPERGPRCRRCGYPVRPGQSPACPECGWEPKSKAEPYKPRRSRRIIALGVAIWLLLLPAYDVHLINLRVFWGESLSQAVVPTTYYVLLYPDLTDSQLKVLADRATSLSFPGAGVGFDYQNLSELPHWQQRYLANRFAQVLDPGSTASEAHQLQVLIWMTTASNATPCLDAAFIRQQLMHMSPQRLADAERLDNPVFTNKNGLLIFDAVTQRLDELRRLGYNNRTIGYNDWKIGNMLYRLTHRYKTEDVLPRVRWAVLHDVGLYEAGHVAADLFLQDQCPPYLLPLASDHFAGYLNHRMRDEYLAAEKHFEKLGRIARPDIEHAAEIAGWEEVREWAQQLLDRWDNPGAAEPARANRM